MKILEVMAEESSHFNAQYLVKRLSKRYPSIGKSTVYRNLPIFIESGLIKKESIGEDRQMLYSLRESRNQDQPICQDCNQVIDYRDAPVENQSRLPPKVRSLWLLAAAGAVAAAIAIGINVTTLESLSSSPSKLKSAESAMMRNCLKEFEGAVAGKSVDQVDDWAEAQENAAPKISTVFKSTQCYAIHEVWEKLAHRNEWAGNNSGASSS